MFSKKLVAASAIALTTFASAAGAQSSAQKSVDASVSVPQMTYESAFANYRRAVETTVSPDKLWREANAAVASEGMHGGSHAGHGAPTTSGSAQRSMPMPAGQNPHAGHGAAAKQPGQGAHEGHDNPAKAATPSAHADHGEHKGANAKSASKADPHAGHDMSTMTKPTTRAPSSVHRKQAKRESSASTPPQLPRKTRDAPGKSSVPVPMPDPHAGHQMSSQTKPVARVATSVTKPPSKPVDEHQRHNAQKAKEATK